MNLQKGATAIACAVLIFTMALVTSGQQPAGDGPRYEGGNALVFPADYRSWPFIGGGLGMTYDDGEGTPSQDSDPTFSHAFVNPSSHDAFLETGVWPDGTIFILEFRQSTTEGSINVGGRFATDVVQLEAEVKDSRFADGWAYYVFGSGDGRARVTEPLGVDQAATCVECHTEHGAVERTFVQFYPTLLEVARARGTLKPGF